MKTTYTSIDTLIAAQAITQSHRAIFAHLSKADEVYHPFRALDRLFTAAGPTNVITARKLFRNGKYATPVCVQISSLELNVCNVTKFLYKQARSIMINSNKATSLSRFEATWSEWHDRIVTAFDDEPDFYHTYNRRELDAFIYPIDFLVSEARRYQLFTDEPFDKVLSVSDFTNSIGGWEMFIENMVLLYNGAVMFDAYESALRMILGSPQIAPRNTHRHLVVLLTRQMEKLYQTNSEFLFGKQIDLAFKVGSRVDPTGIWNALLESYAAQPVMERKYSDVPEALSSEYSFLRTLEMPLFPTRVVYYKGWRD